MAIPLYRTLAARIGMASFAIAIATTSVLAQDANDQLSVPVKHGLHAKRAYSSTQHEHANEFPDRIVQVHIGQ